MAKYSSHAGSYQNALQLIQALANNGIDASITAGGVNIYCTPDQINTAKFVCQENNASFDAGMTRHQEDILIKSRDGYDYLSETTNDAISCLQEWFQS